MGLEVKEVINRTLITGSLQYLFDGQVISEFAFANGVFVIPKRLQVGQLTKEEFLSGVVDLFTWMRNLKANFPVDNYQISEGVKSEWERGSNSAQVVMKKNNLAALNVYYDLNDGTLTTAVRAMDSELTWFEMDEYLHLMDIMRRIVQGQM